MITFQIRTLGEDSRRSDFNDLAQSTYQVELANFQLASAQYDACLFRLEMRDVYRRRFLASASSKREILDIVVDGNPPSPAFIRMYEILDQEIADIEAELPPLSRDICPPEPPVRPELELKE